MPLCQNESSRAKQVIRERVPLQIYFGANQSHLLMKGFARGLVLKQRHKESDHALKEVFGIMVCIVYC